MEAGQCILPAARAVLELLEREWQPLSPGELELRLDQAVEETLEAELVSGLQGRLPAPAAAASWTQGTGLLGRTSPAAVEDPHRPQVVGAAAVQVPSSVPLLNWDITSYFTFSGDDNNNDNNN